MLCEQPPWHILTATALPRPRGEGIHRGLAKHIQAVHAHKNEKSRPTWGGFCFTVAYSTAVGDKNSRTEGRLKLSFFEKTFYSKVFTIGDENL